MKYEQKRFKNEGLDSYLQIFPLLSSFDRKTYGKKGLNI